MSISKPPPWRLLTRLALNDAPSASFAKLAKFPKQNLPCNSFSFLSCSSFPKHNRSSTSTMTMPHSSMRLSRSFGNIWRCMGPSLTVGTPVLGALSSETSASVLVHLKVHMRLPELLESDFCSFLAVPLCAVCRKDVLHFCGVCRFA